MEVIFGFNFKDLWHWKSFVVLLHQPRHASVLAFVRICFGLLMAIDIPQERGMMQADVKYGEATRDACRFPFFSRLQPLSSDYMALLYALLFISAVGIALGFLYRWSCFCFTCIYWYIFLLDKSTWNNHSYLYGLLGILLLCSDAHRYASLDGLLWKNLCNSHVPLWNYTLLRFQVFLVYFYAGLKKTESDWLMGYSMQRLSKNWVFDPLRLFLSDSTLDLLMVHYGGFLLDISAGFLLFFDQTRYIGFVLCGMFHSMNSQLFSIGMFPYMMIATMFVFCYDDSFKNFLQTIKLVNRDKNGETQQNASCIYSTSNARINWRQSFVAVLTVGYIAEQLFLPYSHFITKGYNGWTEGPYGYSWDMMVHNFNNQHIKITYKDKFGKEGYLQPGAFLYSSRSRWSAHPDMTVQYARCLKERLIEMGIEEPEIYFDVWKSLNGRFQQRVIDPTVDLANYDWSPFKTPEFVMPVLSDLSAWRDKLQTMRKELKNRTFDVVFVADFPRMSLENFVQPDFSNTTIEVLLGSVVVATTSSEQNMSLSIGQRTKIPPGEFHIVETTSLTPSCYFYIYHNVTDELLHDRVGNYRKKLESEINSCADASGWAAFRQECDAVKDEDPLVVEMFLAEEAKKNNTDSRSWSEKLSLFIMKKITIFRRSFLVAYYGIRNIVVGRPDTEQLEAELLFMNSWLESRNVRKSVDKSDERIKTEL